MKKLMLTFLGANFLFLASAGLLLGFCIVSEQQENAPKNKNNVAFDVLLTECPLQGESRNLSVLKYLSDIN